MHDIAVLRDLLEKVKAAKGSDREIDVAIECAMPNEYHVSSRPSKRSGMVVSRYAEKYGGRISAWACQRYTQSLEAAMSLVEQELPLFNLLMQIRYYGADPGYYAEFGEFPEVGGASLPLAILAALLSAIIALAERAGHGESGG